MGRNTGLFGAIAVVLVAIFGFSVRPGGNQPSPTPTTGSGQTAPARNSGEIPEPPQQNFQRACREINDRIAQFISNELAAPGSCAEDTAKDVGKLAGTQLPQPLPPPQ